jgi:putative MATE family efflux protein
MPESEESPPPPGPTGGSPPGLMRGSRQNLTEGPITKTLLMFSLPLMGGNILQALNGTVNQFFVAHTLGVSAITALANSNQIMFLMQSGIFGVTMAANILVAQSVGARDLPMVKRIMGSATSFFLVLSITLALLGWFGAPELLAAMHTPKAASDEAIIYLRIMFASMPFTYFFMFMQMAQRGAGDSRTPFYFMALATVLDACLNPCLIRGLGPFPRLGIAGSATSTLIGQGVSFMLLAAWLYRKQSVLVLWPSELKLLKPDFTIIWPLVRRGLPMSMQMLLMSMASVFMMSFVNKFGAITAAAYGGASFVWNYVQMPGMAIGASVSSMAAQNVGANRWDRVERIARSGVFSAMGVAGSVTLLIYALGPLPLYLFLPAGSPTIPIALHINREVVWAFVIFNATFALSGIVRATGAVIPPLIILGISMWGIRVPFAHFMTPIFGADAIWWSFPLGTITSAILTALYYKFGNWRNSRMLEPVRPPGQSPLDGAHPSGVDEVEGAMVG